MLAQCLSTKAQRAATNDVTAGNARFCKNNFLSKNCRSFFSVLLSCSNVFAKATRRMYLHVHRIRAYAYYFDFRLYILSLDYLDVHFHRSAFFGFSFLFFVCLQLCEYAQTWANHLAHTNTFYYRNDREVGQNLYCRPGGAVLTDVTGQDVASYWYSAVKQYDFLKEPDVLHANVNAGTYSGGAGVLLRGIVCLVRLHTQVICYVRIPSLHPAFLIFIIIPTKFYMIFFLFPSQDTSRN